MKDTAKSGSMPLETPAIIDIVPVGAIVVVVAFLSCISLSANMLLAKLGNVPRTSANSIEACLDLSFIKLITFWAVFMPSSES
ncbi:hypothetical protein SDC9_147635 [bioreactor metagenome]|uniref:Uncharacterized protein n=1 Tax=bioreactor metagenome TaxID=1076179 RepID=A0A645EGJ8_9ZZZZ